MELEEPRWLRRIKKAEQREGDSLIIYQAHEGQYNLHPCVRVSFLYNSCPRITARIGDQIQDVERDGTPLEVLKPVDKDSRLFEDLEHTSQRTLEELFEKKKYQEFVDKISDEFEDNRTYVVFMDTASLIGWQARKARRFLSKFRKRMDGQTWFAPSIFLT